MPFVYIDTGSPVVEREIVVNEYVYPVGNFALMTGEELANIGVEWVEPSPGTPFTGPVPTEIGVKEECKRRIYEAASIATQNNLTAAMVLLSVKTDRTEAENADLALFGQAMAWINAMRAKCAELIGDPDFTKDEKWPALSDELKAFAARF